MGQGVRGGNRARVRIFEIHRGLLYIHWLTDEYRPLCSVPCIFLGFSTEEYNCTEEDTQFS
jgi:hypothetical protein